jgi:hypothetical protein
MKSVKEKFDFNNNGVGLIMSEAVLIGNLN